MWGHFKKVVKAEKDLCKIRKKETKLFEELYTPYILGLLWCSQKKKRRGGFFMKAVTKEYISILHIHISLVQERQQVWWVNQRWSGPPEWHNCQFHSRLELNVVTGNWTLNSFCCIFDWWCVHCAATIWKVVRWINNGHLVTAHLSDADKFCCEEPVHKANLILFMSLMMFVTCVKEDPLGERRLDPGYQSQTGPSSGFFGWFQSKQKNLLKVVDYSWMYPPLL